MTKKIQITFASIFALALLVSLFAIAKPSFAVPPIQVWLSCSNTTTSGFSCQTTTNYNNVDVNYYWYQQGVILVSASSSTLNGSCSATNNNYTTIKVRAATKVDPLNVSEKEITFYCRYFAQEKSPGRQVTPSPIE